MNFATLSNTSPAASSPALRPPFCLLAHFHRRRGQPHLLHLVWRRFAHPEHQRHQVGRQLRALEVRLEPQQVRVAVPLTKAAYDVVQPLRLLLSG